MQYILIIKDANARTVLELHFDVWSVARNVADGMERGYSEGGEYDIQIYDNYSKSIAYSSLSKAIW